jgi:transposase
MFFASFKFTAKQVESLHQAYKRAERAGDAAKLKRLSAILLLSEQLSIDKIARCLCVTKQTIYAWLTRYILSGIRGLKSGKSTGRPPKLNKSQRKLLARCLKAGPEKNGFPGNCWRSPLVSHLIQKLFGVLYNVHYISELLHSMNFTYQKAKFVADGRDKQARSKWLKERWPTILKEAEDKNALLLFGDECSFPQWGTLSYTWAPKGKQPVVVTCGKRKCYKVFGLIDYFTGRFFSKGYEGQLNSHSYMEFLTMVMKKTTKKIVLVHDGAPYHDSVAVRNFVETHMHRLSVHKLPSYSPDYNPIEKLWKKIKETGTHLVYFPTFDSLINKVTDMLDLFDDARKEVLALFGFYKELAVSEK